MKRIFNLKPYAARLSGNKMATINVNVSSRREANRVLSKVYAADNSATYSGRNVVCGSSISAIYRAEDKNVEITSSYYLESSLIEMFNK